MEGNRYISLLIRISQKYRLLQYGKTPLFWVTFLSHLEYWRKKRSFFNVFSPFSLFEPLMVYQSKRDRLRLSRFALYTSLGLEPERQHLSRRFAQREARNVRRHMSQELRSVATNDAIRISSARGQP